MCPRVSDTSWVVCSVVSCSELSGGWGRPLWSQSLGPCHHESPSWAALAGSQMSQCPCVLFRFISFRVHVRTCCPELCGPGKRSPKSLVARGSRDVELSDSSRAMLHPWAVCVSAFTPPVLFCQQADLHSKLSKSWGIAFPTSPTSMKLS